ncbi:MAG: flavodoxin [Deltaproteobacteria bacterium]|jgi:flavodoxin|nr:flavodoxin [Deltaproteobacteria bacterium]
MSKNLIAYFTHTGRTRRAAEQIQKAAGGDLFAAEVILPYPQDHNTLIDQAKVEIEAGYKPVLKTDPPDVSGYDTVFVGSPNWWGTIAPPVATLLSSVNLAGKRLIPFVTHGGGGLNRTVADIKKLAPGARVEKGLDANLGEKISAYVRELKLG